MYFIASSPVIAHASLRRPEAGQRIHDRRQEEALGDRLYDANTYATV